jgi:hypothetical protein
MGSIEISLSGIIALSLANLLGFFLLANYIRELLATWVYIMMDLEEERNNSAKQHRDNWN